MFIPAISAFFALLGFSPYLSGVMQQTPGLTFAGAVHYPLDYYYYVSYMAQGKLRWLTSFYLSSSEATSPVFYHWFYVLSGRVFATLGISNILGYQLLVLGLTILLLFATYRLICEILPSTFGRTLAYILFLASNAWPSYWSWYNYGEPFIRFSSIPHHLLAQVSLVTLLLLLARFSRGSQSTDLRTWFFMLLCGFLLVSTQPPLIVLVLLTYGIFWVKDIIFKRDPKTLFPALVLLAAGTVPYLIYLRNLFQNLPYSAIIGWEATQHVHLTLLKFFQINGPVMLAGVIGLPVFLFARKKMRLIIMVFTVLSWGIFLSPIPITMSILNVRFLSIVPTLAMACSAAVLIEAITKRFSLRLAIVIGILALTLPATVQQVIARWTFDPGNAYYFLPNTVFDAYKHVETLIKPEETCLVAWPFHESFTGLTGRMAFTVNEYATVNYQPKERQLNAFFSDQTAMEQKVTILKNNRISCVLTYSFTKNLPPSLTPIYVNSYMTLYRVRP